MRGDPTRRLIVTDTDQSGRSVVLREAAPPAALQGRQPGVRIAGLWMLDPERGAGAVVDSDTDFVTLEPPRGGLSWRIYELSPDKDMAAVDRAGFHSTDTIDLVTILSGEVTLELDDGEVELKPGDCVVQRGTQHAWRNRSSRPVRIMVVMVSSTFSSRPEE